MKTVNQRVTDQHPRCLDPVCSRGLYLIVFFRTVFSITLPFASSIQAL
jgi:hypothetical protein